MKLATSEAENGVLSINGTLYSGRIYIRNGAIIDAETGRFRGLSAIAHLFMQRYGVFKFFRTDIDRERTIFGTNEEIFAKVKDLIVEIEQLRKVIPSRYTVIQKNKKFSSEDQISITPSEWRIISSISLRGNTIDDLIKKLKVDEFEITKIIAKFINLGLLKLTEKVVGEEAPRVESSFFTRLENYLSDIVGPISSILINNGLSELDEKRDNFPQYRLNELLEYIMNNLPEDKRGDFLSRYSNLLPKMDKEDIE